MKTIILSNGMECFVDDGVYEQIGHLKWQATSRKKGTRWYAARKKVLINNSPGSSPSIAIYMHRLITNCPENMQVDHLDGNGLNNVIENLRICTRQQNTSYCKKSKTYNGKPTTSKYKGVGAKKQTRRWKATIRHHRKEMHLGYFKTEKEAARAYDLAALELNGDFALLNFPGPGQRGCLL